MHRSEGLTYGIKRGYALWGLLLIFLLICLAFRNFVSNNKIAAASSASIVIYYFNQDLAHPENLGCATAVTRVKSNYICNETRVFRKVNTRDSGCLCEREFIRNDQTDQRKEIPLAYTKKISISSKKMKAQKTIISKLRKSNKLPL